MENKLNFATNEEHENADMAKPTHYKISVKEAIKESDKQFKKTTNGKFKYRSANYKDLNPFKMEKMGSLVKSCLAKGYGGHRRITALYSELKELNYPNT